jgi:NLI interacting factor-like phosphatase
MSYRPNYSDSWRPPPKRDIWRPPAEDSNFEPDRRWNGTHVRYEEEDDLVFSGRRQFPAGGDSWRPRRHEGHTAIPREEDNDQVKEGSASRKTFDRPPRSRGQRPDPPARSAKPASLPAQLNLNSPVPASTPVDVHRRPSLNDAISAPLRSVQKYARYPAYRVDKYYRSANSSRTAISQNGGSNLNVLTQAAGSRYSLRSGQSTALSPGRFLDNGVDLDQARRVNQQNSFTTLGTFNPMQLQDQRNQVKPPQIRPPPAPTATDLYLAQARLPLIRCAAPKKLLVVLDLNGTLLVRPNRMRPREFRIRPGVPILLDYLFHNHVVMVYSSAQPENVEAMVTTLFSKKHAKKIIAIWGRDKLDLTPAQYREKVQVYKKLEKVWADNKIQATCGGGQRWSQANTVLVDDSHLKALSQPHNLIQVPEFTKNHNLNKTDKKREHAIVASLRAKLEDLKWTHDVSRHIQRWQTGEIEPPHGSKLSPLPKDEGGEPGEQMSESEAAFTSPSAMEDTELDDVQVSLEKDMENLNTNSDGKSDDDDDDDDNGDRMCEPAVSAEEWREFLK